MNCPRCGKRLCLCDQCKRIDKMLVGEVPEGFFKCKGCGFTRPELWWETLEMDVDMEIKFPEPEKKVEEVVPDELSGSQEAGWNS